MPTDSKLPKYRCHKEVHALKIIGVEVGSNGVWLSFEDTRYVRRQVSQDYDRKHAPRPGGYWVLYEDGYESFSPGNAFEAGYTLVS